MSTWPRIVAGEEDPVVGKSGATGSGYDQSSLLQPMKPEEIFGAISLDTARDNDRCDDVRTLLWILIFQ